jgi:hypothetical protein
MYLRFYSLALSNDKFVLDGPYNSIQITYGLVRDEIGREIARYDSPNDGWVRLDDMLVYTDIVVMRSEDVDS